VAVHTHAHTDEPRASNGAPASACRQTVAAAALTKQDGGMLPCMLERRYERKRRRETLICLFPKVTLRKIPYQTGHVTNSRAKENEEVLIPRFAPTIENVMTVRGRIIIEAFKLWLGGKVKPVLTHYFASPSSFQPRNFATTDSNLYRTRLSLLLAGD
jgi:hypothetical protein